MQSTVGGGGSHPQTLRRVVRPHNASACSSSCPDDPDELNPARDDPDELNPTNDDPDELNPAIDDPDELNPVLRCRPFPFFGAPKKGKGSATRD